MRLFRKLIAKLVRREPGAFALSGLTPAAKALYLVLIWQATERPCWCWPTATSAPSCSPNYAKHFSIF